MKTSSRAYSVMSFALLTVSLGIALPALLADDQPTGEGSATEEKAEQKTADAPEATEPDPYAVPDGDAAAMIAFIEKIESIRPTSREEYMEIIKKRAPAVLAAVDKIMASEPTDAQVLQAVKAKLSALQMLGYVDPTAQDKIRAFVASLKDHEVAAVVDIAIQFDLKTRARQWATLSAEDKESLQKELVEFLDRVELSMEHVMLVMNTGQTIEYSGDTATAAALYTKLVPAFQKSKDERIAKFAQKFEGVARRLNLLGNPMKIDGSLLDGSTFDWASYQGKVVLVDFWATWCGPCVQELPNVLANYERYHDKGFDVVGISLDRDSATVKKFVADREIPWAMLYHDGGSGSNPLADYYGILGIPTVILVDQQGKVVSLNARGPELGKQLEKLLGKAEAAEDPAKSGKAADETKS